MSRPVRSKDPMKGVLLAPIPATRTIADVAATTLSGLSVLSASPTERMVVGLRTSRRATAARRGGTQLALVQQRVDGAHDPAVTADRDPLARLERPADVRGRGSP